MSEWPRQKDEIYSYNLFHAAIKSRHNTTGLSSRGFGLVGTFMRIPGGQEDPTPDPDFTLFKDGVLLFVEIKAGENINNSHIDQMREYRELGLEAVEEFAMQTDLAERYNRDDIVGFEHCIVYGEEFIEECKQEYKNCRETLEELAEYTPVLTQQRGSTLQIDSGSFSRDEYNERFSNGIQLPKATDKVIYLPENVELEALSYSITHDIVLNNLNGESFEATASEIQNFHGRRDVRLRKIKQSLQFLSYVEACHRQSDGSYLFRRDDLGDILGIEDLLREKRVEDHLEEADGEQAGLQEFF